MKKKFLALVSLLCSATVCASVGAALLNNNGQVVSAETVTSTWTDETNSKVYTFEGDTSGCTTTDLGDLVPTEYQLPFATETGLTGEATAPAATSENSYHNPAMLYFADQEWTKTTNGVHFQFKTDNEWYRPAGLDGSSSIPSTKEATRIEIYYGDLRIFLIRRNDGSPANYDDLAVEIYSQTAATSVQNYKTCAWGFFGLNDSTQKYDMRNWAEIKIAKYACTAINGDTSAAKGYWLNIWLTKPGDGGANFNARKISVFSGYVAADMSSDQFDNFAIRNATLNSGASPNYKITETGYENYECRLAIRRGDGQVKATVGTETYKDVALLTQENKALAENFTMGFVAKNPTEYRLDADTYDFLSNPTDAALGMEFRTSHLTDITTMQSGGFSSAFMIFGVGTSTVYVNLDTTRDRVTFQPLSDTDDKNIFTYHGTYQTSTPKYEYDLNAEYAWRITRVPVKYTDGTTSMDGKGAIVRIYMGKVNSSTGKPAGNWADIPVLEYYDKSARSDSNARNFGLLVESSKVNGSTEHQMKFSSNQYVGVKTIVGDTVTVNAVERGGNYTLVDLTSENMVHIGWSKGASEYSADDFVAKNTEFTNLNESATYTALALKLTADKTAHLRFRQRAENPLEISLQWNVSSEDIGNVGYYFGNITYGYKITASNGKDSGDVNCMELLETDGVSAPYAYSVIQSGITDNTMEFTFQAYVKFMIDGEQFAICYTPALDMSTYGTSVKDVATLAFSDEAYENLTEEQKTLIAENAQ